MKNWFVSLLIVSMSMFVIQKANASTLTQDALAACPCDECDCGDDCDCEDCDCKDSVFSLCRFGSRWASAPGWRPGKFILNFRHRQADRRANRRAEGRGLFPGLATGSCSSCGTCSVCQ